VQVKGAILLGFVASIVCYLAISIKNKMGYDDSLDVFGIHGVAGIAGALLLSFFIRPEWMEGASQAIGKPWQAWQQFIVQASAVGITIVYTLIVSWILVVIADKFFGIRLKQADEMSGMDHSLHGEQGYGLLNLN